MTEAEIKTILAGNSLAFFARKGIAPECVTIDAFGYRSEGGGAYYCRSSAIAPDGTEWHDLVEKTMKRLPA